MSKDSKIDEKLDLVFERTSQLSCEEIWKAWTHPDVLMEWFCPKPWRVIGCRIELFPGGEFFTLMQGPEGQQIANNGCYLEVIENKRLVWTNMMTKSYRPQPTSTIGFPFVANISLTKIDQGTVYRAVVSHADEEGLKQHEQMGFQKGWGIAFDQLVNLLNK